MSGPIVRTGTTPEFWKNYDRIFGEKKPAAAKKSAAKPAAAATPVPVKKTRGLNPEMLRELESLRLIVGPNAHAVEALRALEHALINKPADNLAVLKNEGDLARANL